ncbi:MAG: OmpA family protein [Alphaproteobacteria bacterium]
MIPKYPGYARTTAAIVIGITVAATAPAGAQTTIGQRNAASVSVDLSVLDQLGSTPNVPQLLQPSVRSLLMPNARQPARSRFAPLGQPQLTPPGASTGTVNLKPPTRTQRRAAPAPKRAAPARPRIAEKPPAKPRMTAPAAPRIAPPPPPKVAAVPKAPVAPPPPAISPPKPAVKAPPPPQQSAALTSRPAPTGALKPGQQFRLGFGSGSAAISDSAGTQLDGIADSMKKDGNLRLQLLAYAGGGSQTPSQARRLSLSRALAVRSQLIEKGIRSTRIDVRALGNKSEGGPPARVDIIITTR